MFFAYGGGYIKEIRNFRQKINRQRLVGREHVCVCVCKNNHHVVRANNQDLRSPKNGVDIYLDFRAENMYSE